MRYDDGIAVRDFRIYTQISYSEQRLLTRYERAGFERVLVWADQVWLPGSSLDKNRARLAELANELGIEGGVDKLIG